MSDTTGWDWPSGRYRKEINRMWFECERVNFGPKWPEWCLKFNYSRVAFRDTLEECQILAHDTARLWAGESE
jgi:hypothetical protein